MTPSQQRARELQTELKRLERGEVNEVTLGRRHLKRGTLITITGERGTFVFKSAIVKDGECQSICVFGGAHGRYGGKWRHFRPERIKSVKRVQEVRA